jgi:hypothetical protein
MNAVNSLVLSINSPNRLAGILLVASLLVLILALIIMIVSGATPGFSAMLRGSLAEVVPYVATFRLVSLLFAVAWIVQLLGLGLLTRLLVRAGDEQIAILAFTLILVATILAVVYTTFRMSVELWAGEEAARTGNIPEVFEPLKAWTNDFFRVAYRVHLLAVAGFGWGILRTGLLAPGVGQAAMGWSVLWLIGGLVGVGAPAIPLIMPAVIGVALLMRQVE